MSALHRQDEGLNPKGHPAVSSELATNRRRIVCLAGTHGKTTGGAWADPRGGFAGFLGARGIDYHLRRDPYSGILEPYSWSGDLAGWWWTGSSKHSAWDAMGDSLRWWVCDAVGIPGDDTVLLTHSNGVQGAIKAAAKGMRVHVLFDVCGPIRDDMRDDVLAALPNIRYWFHVRAADGDAWQWLGSLDMVGRWFDVQRDAIWRHPATGRLIGAHSNASVPGIGHTKLLDDPDTWPLWDSQGFIDVLKMPAPARAA